MKNVVIAIAVILIIGVGALFLVKKPDSETAPTATGNTPTTPSTGSSPITYKDGTFTGQAFQTDGGYGSVQVAAVINSGKISDIQFLQMPNLPGHTSDVTAMAEPALKQEAIQSQTSSVDIVSGATQTSQAFQQSLASALAMAK